MSEDNTVRCDCCGHPMGKGAQDAAELLGCSVGRCKRCTERHGIPRHASMASVPPLEAKK